MLRDDAFQSLLLGHRLAGGVEDGASVGRDLILRGLLRHVGLGVLLEAELTTLPCPARKSGPVVAAVNNLRLRQLGRVDYSAGSVCVVGSSGQDAPSGVSNVVQQGKFFEVKDCWQNSKLDWSESFGLFGFVRWRRWRKLLVTPSPKTDK